MKYTYPISRGVGPLTLQRIKNLGAMDVIVFIHQTHLFNYLRKDLVGHGQQCDVSVIIGPQITPSVSR